MTLGEAAEVINLYKNSWPFRQISTEEIRKLEQANRIIKQKELHSNESPL